LDQSPFGPPVHKRTADPFGPPPSDSPFGPPVNAPFGAPQDDSPFGPPVSPKSKKKKKKKDRHDSEEEEDDGAADSIFGPPVRKSGSKSRSRGRGRDSEEEDEADESSGLTGDRKAQAKQAQQATERDSGIDYDLDEFGPEFMSETKYHKALDFNPGRDYILPPQELARRGDLNQACFTKVQFVAIFILNLEFLKKKSRFERCDNACLVPHCFRPVHSPWATPTSESGAPTGKRTVCGPCLRPS